MPAFSWKMAPSGTGTPSALQGTATFTSKWPRPIIHAKSSKASLASASGGASGNCAKRRSTCSRNASPRSMAAISSASRVQPTKSRMWPSLRTSPSMPRAANAKAPALK